MLASIIVVVAVDVNHIVSLVHYHRRSCKYHYRCRIAGPMILMSTGNFFFNLKALTSQAYFRIWFHKLSQRYRIRQEKFVDGVNDNAC
jgi:hypothetical protein